MGPDKDRGNAEFIRRWFEEVWNKGRLDVIDEWVSPNAVGHGQAEHSVDVGPAEFKKLASNLRTAFPDIRITIHDTLTKGDLVLARWTATMTHSGMFLGHPGTNRKATVTGMSMQRVVDGKIVEAWDNWDQLGLLVQLGIVPAAKFASDNSSAHAS